MAASALLPELATQVVVPAAAVLGVAFAVLQWVLVSKVKMSPDQRRGAGADGGSAAAGKSGATEYLMEEEEELNDHNVVVKCAEIQNAIFEGATSFLFTEYKYVGLFMGIFAILIFVFLGSVEGFTTKSQPCHYSKNSTCKPALANAIFSTIAFVLGAVTSIVSGFLGMKIATYANAMTTLEARKGVGKASLLLSALML